jgi:hypothetical protein
MKEPIIRITLERKDGKRGYAYWESDRGLQCSMIDSKTGCKIVAMDELYGDDIPKDIVISG